MGSNDIYIGQMLDDRYEILEKIGVGGMAVVYKARCHRLNRLVAIKVLRNDLAQDADIKRRFRAESQAVAMMSHPNIVGVYDVCQSGELEYIVMELIEGISLKQYITRKGVLTWKEVLHFTIQICKALSHAHSRGIIHRDIKPHNILILKDGSVKVTDFGIALLLNAQQTMTNQTFGSVHYISPEQAKGAHVDARSDLYSVGVVMYEMLTAKLPFEGDTAVSVALQHISATPLMPREVNPDVPAGLEDITMHAMEANLSKRYTSADEILHDLEEFRKNPAIIFNFDGRSVKADQGTQKVPAIKTPKAPAKAAGAAAAATGAAAAAVTGAAVTAASTPTMKDRAKQFMTNPPAEESYYKAKQRSARTSMLVGTLCVVIFLVVLFMFLWNYFLKGTFNTEEERVTVPNFIGMEAETVTSSREYLIYYNFNITYEISDTVPKGQIMEQNPEAGRQMTIQDDGIDIDIVVSDGAEAIQMPNIINKDYREAKLLLDTFQLDLDIILEGEYSDDVTNGYVMEQFPDAGEELVEGGTVYITYSTGPETFYVTVPNVVNLSQSNAILRLESYDLKYEIEEVEDEAKAGTVIFQSIEAGKEVKVKTKITLRVSTGPAVTEPTPPPATEPTPPPATEPTPEPTA